MSKQYKPSAIKPLKHFCGGYMAMNYCWQMPKLQNLGGMCQVKWPKISKFKAKNRTAVY